MSLSVDVQKASHTEVVHVERPEDQEDQEDEEVLVVALADAVADEEAVAGKRRLLVEVLHAVVAMLAVRRERRLRDLAGVAIAVRVDARLLLVHLRVSRRGGQSVPDIVTVGGLIVFFAGVLLVVHVLQSIPLDSGFNIEAAVVSVLFWVIEIAHIDSRENSRIFERREEKIAHEPYEKEIGNGFSDNPVISVETMSNETTANLHDKGVSNNRVSDHVVSRMSAHKQSG